MGSYKRPYEQKKKEHAEHCRRCGTKLSAKWARYKNATIHLRPWCPKCQRMIGGNPIPACRASEFGLHSKDEERERQLVAYDVGGFLSEDDIHG